MRRIIYILLGVLVGIFVVSWSFSLREEKKPVTNFEECRKAGYPVPELYPSQCRTPEGAVFTEEIGNEVEKADLIKIFSPRPNAAVRSPLEVQGEARGFWFFEASFPGRVTDSRGNDLGVAPITTEGGEWMTEAFVSFRGTIVFRAPETETGWLVLEKDNPSGLPEHADELRIPVRFSP